MFVLKYIKEYLLKVILNPNNKNLPELFILINRNPLEVFKREGNFH
jgi:hypothetical protein